jgi:hypothetical protein
MASMSEVAACSSVEMMGSIRTPIVSKDQSGSLELRSRRNDGVDCGYMVKKKPLHVGDLLLPFNILLVSTL